MIGQKHRVPTKAQKAFLTDRKQGLCQSGSGSALPIRIRIQDSQIKADPCGSGSTTLVFIIFRRKFCHFCKILLPYFLTDQKKIFLNFFHESRRKYSYMFSKQPSSQHTKHKNFFNPSCTVHALKVKPGQIGSA